MLRLPGFGRVLLTSLLVGCEWPLGPWQPDFCPFPKVDTVRVEILNEEHYRNLCKQKYRGFRNVINTCIRAWNDKTKNFLIGDSFEIYNNDYSNCSIVVNPEGRRFPSNPFPGSTPRYP